MKLVDNIWYGDRHPSWILRAGSGLFGATAAIRRQAYRAGLLPKKVLPCPVIVVGNITVGGSGKTPLVLWLVECLQMSGYKPGIISRGYGGSHQGGPLLVTRGHEAAIVGDEAALLTRRSGLPVAICRDRAAAGRYLVENTGVNVLVADDGLQHYALARDIEICVVDGSRRLGNGHLLPAGPLREPAWRLQEMDFVVSNGASGAGEFEMQLVMEEACALGYSRARPLEAFAATPVNAIAGIGHPNRFFNQLRRKGLEVIQHAFTDHHRFRLEDLEFGNPYPILMTEKDAVKCTEFDLEDAWAVPISVNVADEFTRELLDTLAYWTPPNGNTQASGQTGANE